MSVSIKQITSMVLAGLQEWEWHVDNQYIDVTKTKLVRFALKTTLETYAELLPRQRKILSFKEYSRVSQGNLIQLAFSNKKKYDCQNQYEDIDFDFDILSIHSVHRADYSESVIKNATSLKMLSFDDFMPYLKDGYAWCCFDDRQILKINAISQSMSLILDGRFSEFDICGENVDDELLEMPNRYLQPVISITAYEVAKMLLKEKQLESLKIVWQEATDNLKKFKTIGR